jgi:mycothiol synthase
VEAAGVAIELRMASHDADLLDWAAVRSEVTPTEPVAGQQVRNMVQRDPTMVLLLATVDGDMAGCGIARRSDVRDMAFVAARVLPAFRRRGVGSALMEALLEPARGLGVDGLAAMVLADDEAAMRFAARWGFTEVGREAESRLRLDESAGGAELVPLPDGLELQTLGARPDLVSQVHALAVETSGEIGGAEDIAIPPLDVWRAENVDDALPDGSFVAVAGGRVVGSAGLTGRPAEPGVAEHLLTAVTRAWRRRGVARALKAAQIDWARRHGYAELMTFNNAANDPMRRLNAELGYRLVRTDVRFHRPMPPPPER